MWFKFALPKRIACCLLMVAAGPWFGVIRASDSPDGQISGFVRDGAGKPLADVEVSLSDSTGRVLASVTTSSNGSFMVDKVPSGQWQVKAACKGYHQITPAILHLRSSQKANIELTLQPWTSATGLAANSKPSTTAEFYQSSSLEADAVVGAVDPAGYSSPPDANATARLLSGAAALRQHPASEGQQPIPQGAPSEQNFYDQGADLLAHHEAAKALEVFEAGIAPYPKSADLWIGKGIALYMRGEHDDAVRALTQATDIDPKAYRPYLFLADVSGAARKEYPAAAERLKRFAELYPQDARAVFYFALSRMRQWEGTEAREGGTEVEALLKKSLALDPRFADAHLQLGSFYASENRYPEAIEQYRQTIALDPSSAAAHYKLGQALERSGDRAQATQEFKLYEDLHQQSTPAQQGTRKDDSLFDIVRHGAAPPQ